MKKINLILCFLCSFCFSQKIDRVGNIQIGMLFNDLKSNLKTLEYNFIECNKSFEECDKSYKKNNMYHINGDAWHNSIKGVEVYVIDNYKINKDTIELKNIELGVYKGKVYRIQLEDREPNEMQSSAFNLLENTQLKYHVFQEEKDEGETIMCGANNIKKNIDLIKNSLSNNIWIRYYDSINYNELDCSNTFFRSLEISDYKIDSFLINIAMGDNHLFFKKTK